MKKQFYFACLILIHRLRHNCMDESFLYIEEVFRIKQKTDWLISPFFHLPVKKVLPINGFQIGTDDVRSFEYLTATVGV
jgi:hypothetical protein